MYILAPILIATTILVIYGFVFQFWPAGWVPLMMMLSVGLISGVGIKFYLDQIAPEEEREAGLSIGALLPAGVALLFGLLFTAAWLLPPLRAGTTALVALDSPGAVEVALHESSPLVRKHACMELVRHGAAKHSQALMQSFDAHPKDAARCISEIKRRGLSDGVALAETLSQRWSRHWRPSRRHWKNASPAEQCRWMRGLAAAQEAAALSPAGSPDILECSFKASHPEVRACCAQTFKEMSPSGEDVLASEALRGHRADPELFFRLVRAAWGAGNASRAEIAAGHELALQEQKPAFLRLGCNLLDEDDPDVQREAQRGLMHIASRLPCARSSHQAQLLLVDRDVWTPICTQLEETKDDDRLEPVMCQSLEYAWTRAAFHEAYVRVWEARQRARLNRISTIVPISDEVRGYGRSGSSGQRKDTKDDIIDTIVESGTGSVTRGQTYRAGGSGGVMQRECPDLNFGDAKQRRLLNTQGVGCQRDSDSIDEILARRRDFLNAIQGDGSIQSINRREMRRKMADGAVDRAYNDMKNAYDADAKAKGMKPMKLSN